MTFPLFILISFFLYAGEFEHTIEKNKNSSINWTQMRLQGKASVEQNGPTDDYAKQEARALALAHKALKETFELLKIDSKTTLDDITSEDSKTKRYILANAKKYKVSQTNYHESGGVSVQIYWDMHSLLRPVIIQNATEGLTTAKPKNHTGIIIDTRGLNFEPVLFPEVSKDGQSTWLSVAGFSKKQAETKIPFIYAPHAAHEEVITRVGENPAIFVGNSISENRIVINDKLSSSLSEEDAQAIMANGNVVIIIDL
jgi:hypothetical protein